MSRFKLIFAIILICIASTSCAIFEGHKKDGGPISPDYCAFGNIMAAYFIDGSGTYPDAIYDSMYIGTSDISSYCNNYRLIIAGVSDGYVPWPKNVTTRDEASMARNWLNSTLQPYRGIFDLQTSVNTFFTLPQYSSYNPLKNRPPWAVIYAYSDTVGGMNNLLNGISQLQSKGYMVLLVSSQLTRYKMSQLLQVLPQSNVISTKFGIYESTAWLISRYNAGYTVPTVNQTGTSGYVTSPNYPYVYDNLSLLEYYIIAPSTYNAILLTINDFNLNLLGSTALLVYQGSIMDDDDYLHNWKGNMPVQNFTIQSNALTLRFVTDFSSVRRGFNISWTAI